MKLKIFIPITIIFIVSIVMFLNVFKNTFYLYLGEKLFLEYNQNGLAVSILKKIDYNNLEAAPNQEYYKYYLLGRIHFVENELYKSIENYNKSIELNSKHKESYYGRGLSYGFSSPLFLKDAEKDFQKYIYLEKQEFQTNGRRAYGAWAGYNDLAWIYFLQNEFQKSEAISREGLKISSDNPWLLNMLGVALIEQDKCEEAYEILQKAKILTTKMLPEQFGEAYSGDSKKWWSQGLFAMKKNIEDNINLCAYKQTHR